MTETGAVASQLEPPSLAFAAGFERHAVPPMRL
jgi:hypothetical protein